jgi:hypothetical protein
MGVDLEPILFTGKQKRIKSALKRPGLINTAMMVRLVQKRTGMCIPTTLKRDAVTAQLPLDIRYSLIQRSNILRRKPRRPIPFRVMEQAAAATGKALLRS